MRIWLIQWEEFSGDEYTVLVASKGMDMALATAHAQKAMQKRDRFTDPTDITAVEFKRVLRVNDLAGNTYQVTLWPSYPMGRKGGKANATNNR